MIYFTSDTHFFHGNILRHQNRPWATVEEMNDALIRNINECVGLTDELYVLGDFSFKAKQAEVWELRKRIICRNVHLIRGNHDCGWDGTDAFKSVSDYLELKHDAYKLVLCHYPFESWNGSRRGWSIHLHGHSHNDADYNLGNIEAGLLRFDVGMDANGYKPVSLEAVLEWAEMAKETERHPRPRFRSDGGDGRQMRVNKGSLEAIFSSCYGERALKYYRSLLDYQRAVTEMPFLARIARGELEGGELSERLAAIDGERAIRHDAAIASLGTLNRISEELGNEPVIDCEPCEARRADVADAVFEHVKDMLDSDMHSGAGNYGA